MGRPAVTAGPGAWIFMACGAEARRRDGDDERSGPAQAGDASCLSGIVTVSRPGYGRPGHPPLAAAARPVTGSVLPTIIGGLSGCTPSPTRNPTRDFELGPQAAEGQGEPVAWLDERAESASAPLAASEAWTGISLASSGRAKIVTAVFSDSDAGCAGGSCRESVKPHLLLQPSAFLQ